jgi:hypothetical protein
MAFVDQLVVTVIGGEQDTKGVSHFVASMTAPVAAGRVGLTTAEKRRLSTTHTQPRRRACIAVV